MLSGGFGKPSDKSIIFNAAAVSDSSILMLMAFFGLFFAIILAAINSEIKKSNRIKQDFLSLNLSFTSPSVKLFDGHPSSRRNDDSSIFQPCTSPLDLSR